MFILGIAELPYSGARLEQLIFEQTSAFGTVGLSTNTTSPVALSGLLGAQLPNARQRPHAVH